MLLLVTASFYLIPPIFGLDALAQDTSNTLADPSTAEFPRLLLGTDQLGRSIFVRSLVGGQFSIQIALVVSLGTTILGHHHRGGRRLLRWLDRLRCSRRRSTSS